MDPPTTTCEASPAAAAAQLCRGSCDLAPADEMMGTTGACGRLGGQRGFAVTPYATVRRRFGDLQAALHQIEQRCAQGLG